MGIFKLIILFIFVAFQSDFVRCETVEDTESCQSYNFVKLIENSAKHISTSKSLESAPGDDTFVNEFSHFLQESIHPILGGLLSQKASFKCFHDLKYVFDSLGSGGWALKMLDAFGKPESGILMGNLKWLGEYDECLSVYAPPKVNTSIGHFYGKYCSLKVPINLRNLSLFSSVGVCLPDSCKVSGSTFNVEKNLNLTGLFSASYNEKTDAALNSITVTCQHGSRKLNPVGITVICVISLFATLAVIGSSITIYEYVMKTNVHKKLISGINVSEKSLIKNDEERTSFRGSDEVLLIGKKHPSSPSVWLQNCKAFFNYFCIFTNGEKILNTSNTEGQLPCLHGIRFLSMSWIILCHTYAFSFSNSIRNMAETVDFIDHWTFQIILNGFYSVDSFFLLSGFLVSYIFFLHSHEITGKIPWIYFYIHRYIRLTPVYAIVLAFYTTLNSRLGSGPIWPDFDIDPNCKTQWWWNILYINNFVPMVDQCMPWSWYLANDMQFYIISPLFLITLLRWPKVGYSMLGLFFCITFTSNFVITYEYNVLTGLGNVVEEVLNLEQFLTKFLAFFDKLYVKPYARISPYLVGITLAFYLHKRKQNNSGKLSWISLSVGWIVASGATLTCLFILYHKTPPLVAASFYNALHRFIFACGLAWVVFTCVTGQGGVVNKILSWKVWIPLSRITFCAYLIHPIVQNVYFLSIKRLIEYSQITMVIYYLGFLIASYGIAFATSLLFESPVIRLERFIRNKLTP